MELFITLLLICGACLLFMQYYSRPIEKPDRLSGRKVRYPKAPIFIFWVTVIYVSAFRYGFCDTGLYRDLCKAIGTDYARASDETFAINDVGFNYLMIFLNRCGFHPQMIIVVTSVIIFTIYARAIQKYSQDIPYSLLLFLMLSYCGMINGIRQVLAGAVIFLGLPFLRDKKFMPYALLVLLASTIHASAIIMLPLYFVISGKRINWLVWVFFGVVVVFFVAPGLANSLLGTLLEDSTYKDYLTTEAQMGIMRLLVAAVPVALSIVYAVVEYRTRGADGELSESDRLTDVLINMQLLSFGFTTLGLRMVYFARLAMYFEGALFLLLPRAIKGSFNTPSARFVKVASIGLYTLYFAYQIITFQSYGYFNDFRFYFKIW